MFCVFLFCFMFCVLCLYLFCVLCFVFCVLCFVFVFVLCFVFCVLFYALCCVSKEWFFCYVICN